MEKFNLVDVPENKRGIERFVLWTDYLVNNAVMGPEDMWLELRMLSLSWARATFWREIAGIKRYLRKRNLIETLNIIEEFERKRNASNGFCINKC